MRSLWIDEKIMAGKIKKNSLTNKFFLGIERVLLKNSSKIISLTKSGKKKLIERYPKLNLDTKISVIPTCVETSRFSNNNKKKDRKIFAHVGSLLNGWFDINFLQTYIKTALDFDKELIINIVSREDKDKIYEALSLSNSHKKRVDVFSLEFDDVPKYLQKISASMIFMLNGDGKLGSMPTRLGELMATGVPIILNNSSPDVAEMIENYRIGVNIEDFSKRGIINSIESIEKIIFNPKTKSLCSKITKDYFSVDSGVKEYKKIYKELILQNLLESKMIK